MTQEVELKNKVALVAAALTLAVVAASVRADDTFRCELKESSGLSAPDAAAAAQIVCQELKREAGGRGAYGVTVSTLGKLFFVRATREDTGIFVDARVDALEEIPIAATRIAEALVRDRAFAATQRVDNLLEAETREPLTKGANGVRFSMGVVGLQQVGHGGGGAGFSVGLLYSTPRFALPAEMRAAWGGKPYGEAGGSLFSLSTGGRGYFGRGSVSPFAGAGLSMLRQEVHEGEYSYGDRVDPDYFQASQFGIAPYVEAGVEVLRLHRAHLALRLRADIPLGSLRSEAIDVWTSGRFTPGLPAQDRYVVPATFEMNVTF